MDMERTAAGSSASYSVPAKLIATVLVGLVAVTAWRAWDQLLAPELLWQRLALLGACAWLGLCLLSIYRARTTVDGNGIAQSGLWSRRVVFTQITHVKLVHVPVLAWLIAPRLVVKLKGGGTATFHAADVRLLRQVAQGKV